MESDSPDTLRVRRTSGYESVREDIMRHVPLDARRILDVGCSSGRTGLAIKNRQAARVTGVEIDEELAADAALVLDRVIVTDIQSAVINGDGLGERFDCVIAADVLEHLTDPWATLAGICDFLDPGGVAVISVPNVRFHRVLRQVVLGGRWPREDQGVFDRTHLRWFTRLDALDLARQAGLEVSGYHPLIWEEIGAGRRRRALFRLLKRSPLRDFLPAQMVITAVKPGA